MSKIHYLDVYGDLNIPKEYKREYRQQGFRSAKCGYLRKHTTLDISKVDCKICLKEMSIS